MVRVLKTLVPVAGTLPKFLVAIYQPPLLQVLDDRPRHRLRRSIGSVQLENLPAFHVAMRFERAAVGHRQQDFPVSREKSHFPFRGSYGLSQKLNVLLQFSL